ncbi:antibiotic acetyltransferase [Solimonas marina]|nr:antibiotic acetyltransferase [Solimonas marina]
MGNETVGTAANVTNAMLDLKAHGLIADARASVIGAFTYFNSAGVTSAYRAHFGRYAQIAESVIVGAPEHPLDWFSTHPIAFTRPAYMPNLYQLPDFARMAPDAQPGPSYVDTVPSDTIIEHEAYLCAGVIVRRGVTVGAGAVVGAGSVVTKDVPPYAIVAGSPARVIRMRFSDAIIARFLKLQWWRYDLAPFKNQIDFRAVEAALDFLEARAADGQLQPLIPDSYCVTRSADNFAIKKLPQPLFFHHPLPPPPHGHERPNLSKAAAPRSGLHAGLG